MEEYVCECCGCTSDRPGMCCGQPMEIKRPTAMKAAKAARETRKRK